MKTCKSCIHIRLSKNHLNQGTCNRIVQVGTIPKYREGKLTLSKEQVAGFIDKNDDHTVSLLVNIDTFGCNLFEGEKPSGFKDLSNSNKEISTKSDLGPKKTKPIENNLGSK